MVPARAPADGTAAAACEPQVRDESYDSSRVCLDCLFSGFACSCAGPAAPLLAVAAAAACANESFSKPPPVRAAAGAAEDAQPELGAPLVSRLGVRRFGDTLQPNTQPLGVSAFGGNPATNIFDETYFDTTAAGEALPRASPSAPPPTTGRRNASVKKESPPAAPRPSILPSPSAHDAKIELYTVSEASYRPAFAGDGLTRREEPGVEGAIIQVPPRRRKPSARAVTDNGEVVTPAARKRTTRGRKAAAGAPGVAVGKGKKVAKNKVVSDATAGVRNDTGARIPFPYVEMIALLLIVCRPEFTCAKCKKYPAGIKWAAIATAIVAGGPNGEWGVLYHRMTNCMSPKMSDKAKCLSKKFFQSPEGQAHRINMGLTLNRRYR